MKAKRIKRQIITKPGWLTKRFGNCYAQISTATTLKLKSSIKDVFRALYGDVPSSIEALCKKLPVPPQGVSDKDFIFGYEGNEGWVPGVIETSDTLKEFITKYPKEWEAVQKVISLSRQRGRHASAYIVADEPIENFIPLTTVGGVKVTQFDASGVEAVGGLKMDFLVVNSIRDIDVCLKMIRSRHPLPPTYSGPIPPLRAIPFKGEVYDVWDLPEDSRVFSSICSGDTETVFQFNTSGAKKWLQHFNYIKKVDADGTEHKALDSIEDLAAFTALDRPGPLDINVKGPTGQEHNMLVEFAIRARGGEHSGGLPILSNMLPETHGILVYQEQLTRIFREVGQSTAIEAENFRVHTSKKQMSKVLQDKEIFMRGAVKTLGPDIAETLWTYLLSFARYGFNKSHAVCYVVIGYACAWLKYHYPLEWWCSVLQNADRNEIDEKFWRYCGHLVDIPDLQLSTHNFEIQGDKIRAPLWLMHGVGEKAHEQLMRYAPYLSMDDFCEKILLHKQANMQLVTQTRKNSKTGEEVKTVVERPGRSALTDSTIYKMIIGGAMDSFFAPDMMIQEKLYEYEKSKHKYNTNKGKKEIASHPIRTGYHLITEVKQYQMVKQILPSFCRNVAKSVIKCYPDKFRLETSDRGYKWLFAYNDKIMIKVLGKDMIQALDTLPLPSEGTIESAICYVVAQRNFTYNKEENPKTACSLTLEIDGHRFDMVQWPGRKGLPPVYEQQLVGAVGVAIIKKQQDRDCTLMDFVVLSESLSVSDSKKQQEEESNE